MIPDSPTSVAVNKEQLNGDHCNGGQTVTQVAEVEVRWAAVSMQIEKCKEVQRTLQGNILALQANNI